MQFKRISMPQSRTLTTDWKRIGRSGPTVDGRVIDPHMLLEAAETYDKERYTALIWPEHIRSINYGTVERLRAQTTNDGVDLYAILSPNKFYLETNQIDQRLFLSMELRPNFAKSGKTYLTGLAATDDPASLGTSEMRFSNEGNKAGIFYSNHEEVSMTAPTPADTAEALSLIGRLSALFSKPKEESDMADKAELEQLNTELAALKAEFAKLKPAEQPAGKPEDTIVKLSKQVEDLTAQVAKLTEDKANADAKKATDDIITKLSSQVDELSTKLSAALADSTGGTKSGEHVGGEGEADKFKDIY